MQELTFEQVELVAGGNNNSSDDDKDTNQDTNREVHAVEHIACYFIEGTIGATAGYYLGVWSGASTLGSTALIGGGINVAAAGFGWCEKLLSTKADYDGMMIAP